MYVVYIYIDNFLRNQLVKFFENWSLFAKVIIKHQLASFFETQCIYSTINTEDTEEH